MNPLESMSRNWVRHQLQKCAPNEVRLVDDWRPPSKEEIEETTALTVRIKSPDFYSSLLMRGSLGLASSYAEGHFECKDLTSLFRILLRARRNQTQSQRFMQTIQSAPGAFARKFKRKTKSRSKAEIAAHYDIGNDLFELILDPTMTYSCGVFNSDHATLQDASIEKLDIVCRTLRLEQGMKILETGSGWGSFAIHAAKNYGCEVVSVTLSEEQFSEASQRVSEAGLAGKVEIRLQDYRDVQGSFDRIVSIEMIEAIGHDQLQTYFRKCSSLLRPDGEMFLQVITMPESRYKNYLRTTDFIREVIFPGSCCPSKSALLEAISESTDMTVLSQREIGQHYARTLIEWRKNLELHKSALSERGYSEKFFRLWNYYFCYCEAGFAENYIGNSQFHLCKPESIAMKIGQSSSLRSLR